jgi:hypothetical protein
MPLWSELRRDITERRVRIVTRLRAHLDWLERRKVLLEHLSAERIVPEVAVTKQTDGRVRAEVSQAIAELNTLVRRHNLIVTATSLHLATVTLKGSSRSRAPGSASYAARSPRWRRDGGGTGPRRR